MVACPLSQLARRFIWLVSAAAPIELYMKYNLWHGTGVVGLAVFGWHACAILSATLGQRGRLNRLRLTILVILGLEWVFEIELWFLFYRITLWIRSFTGPEVY
jgi:multidrug transporter EmrE-like cation transporter